MWLKLLVHNTKQGSSCQGELHLGDSSCQHIQEKNYTLWLTDTARKGIILDAEATEA